MSARSLGVLALVSMALLVTALFDPWLASPRVSGGRLLDPMLETSLSQLVFDDGSSRYQLERQHEQWLLVEPAKVPANAEAVRKIVESMMLLRSLREADLDKVGAPTFAIEFQGASGEGRLAFGSLSADGQHRWMRSSGSARAHLVEAHLADEIVAAGASLISDKLVPFEIDNNVALRLELAQSWMEISEAGLSMAAAEGPMPLDEKSRAFRSSLHSLRFQSVGLDAGACAGSDTLRIAQAGQEAGLRDCGACGPTQLAIAVGMRRGCLDAAAWQELVAAVAEPSSIADPALLPPRPRAFSLHCGSEGFEVDPAEVDPQRLASWWQELNASALSLTPRRDIEAQCTLQLDDHRIEFGVLDGAWFAVVEGQAFMRSLSELAPSLIKVSALRFASLDLISQEPLFANRIEMQAGRNTEGFVLEREQLGGSWRERDKAWDETRATATAGALASELAMLRATGYVEGKESLGLGLQGKIVFDSALGDGESSYSLRVYGDAQACQVSVGGGPLAQLSQDSCHRLWQALEP